MRFNKGQSFYHLADGRVATNPDEDGNAYVLTGDNAELVEASTLTYVTLNEKPIPVREQQAYAIKLQLALTFD